jgi:hypothetical protein
MPTAHAQLPRHVACVDALLPTPGNLVKTKDTFVIDFTTFTPQQGVNAQILKAATLRLQLNPSTSQLLLSRLHLWHAGNSGKGKLKRKGAIKTRRSGFEEERR